jgi:hypothetical protein
MAGYRPDVLTDPAYWTDEPIEVPPTSAQRFIFLGAPSRRLDRAMARTLSETP